MLNSSNIVRDLTQPIFNNNINEILQYNEVNKNSNYNTEIDFIKVLSQSNGKNDYLNINLNNNDFNDLLCVPSVNIPLDKRLKLDLIEKYNNEYSFNDTYNKNELPIVSINKPLTSYLSSPLPEEELIIPITINNKNKNKHSNKLKKKHKTYRVFKKLKSNMPKTKSSHKYSNSSSMKPPLSSRIKSNNFFTISNSI